MYDAKTQARSLNMAVLLFIYPLKRIENIGDIFFFYTLARITDGIPDPDSVQSQPLTPHGKSDGAFACVFYQLNILPRYSKG